MIFCQICQLAELNPNAIFLKVNYEELKTMCYSLHIHVLPMFRFYRGAEGRVCSFSCTNATVRLLFIARFLITLKGLFVFQMLSPNSCITDQEIQRCIGKAWDWAIKFWSCKRSRWIWANEFSINPWDFNAFTISILQGRKCGGFGYGKHRFFWCLE